MGNSNNDEIDILLDKVEELKDVALSTNDSEDAISLVYELNETIINMIGEIFNEK